MSDIKQYGNHFTFDDIVSSDYYVWISGSGTFDAPVRSVEYIQIPGRSGDLIRENNRYNNIDITYPCFISKAFPNRFDAFRAKLMSKAGHYYLLQDTYHPAEFRMATITGSIQPETGPFNQAGQFDLTFNCKPQRYLVSGLIEQEYTASGTITNPTLFTAKPHIRIYGTGTLVIGAVSITIASNSYEYIDIDCEAMDCFYQANNANGYVSITGTSFPTLGPGATNVLLGTGITRVVFTPRWFTI